MPLPPISEAQIRQGAADESFARGLAYYQSGAVGQMLLRGDTLQAEVEGSSYAPYRVTVRLGPGGILATSCTCPYDYGGWCKHIVATLLAYQRAAPGDVAQRPPFAELLAGVERERLVALLLRMAEHDPAVADLAEQFLAASAPPPAAGVAAAPEQHTPADLAAFRRTLRSVFRGAGRYEYDSYDVSDGIVSALEPLVEQIRALVQADDAERALPLLDVLTAEYSEQWVQYDDSYGNLGDFFDTLGGLWAEALLMADLPRGERATWQRRLDELGASAAEYGVDGLDLALIAAEEGWDAPGLAAAMGGDPDDTGALHANLHRLLLPTRLLVLERKGLLREALNLAAAAGMHSERALLLVRMRRTAEAAQLACELFQTATEALALAQALREQGDLAAALAVGEHGLGLAEPRAALAAWLADLAAGQGRIELALRAGEEALRAAPELGLYRRMAELAGPAWPPLRERLLDAQRHPASPWQNVSGRIDLFLHEGLIDDAITLVSSHPASNELGRVMDAAVATHPDWVIRTATAKADGIAEAGVAKHYAVAVEWLRRARAAYRAAGRAEQWASYLQALRARHARKRNLMELLDQLERSRP